MALQHRDIASPDLFFRLSEGHKAGITVLTPNRRLAQALQRDFDRLYAGRVPFWETADILPFDAFVQRLWDEALHSELGASLPLLAAPAQEQALWEQAIAASPRQLQAIAAAAAQCREAWSLAHDWALEGALAREAATDDARAFVEWSRAYERLAREHGMTDGARLPAQLAPLLCHDALRKPRLLVMYGFDVVTPRQESFLQALAGHSVEIAACRTAPRAARPVRVAFDTPAEELEAAARWARSRLEGNPGARIGIVVPDLAGSRKRVRHALARVLQPTYQLAREGEAVLPFDISLAEPLSQAPLVHDALALLRLCGSPIAFELASRLVRSPFVAGADAEMGVRARLDAVMRKRSAADVSLEGVLRVAASPSAPRAPVLLERFDRLAAHRKAALFGTRGAGEWARAFTDAMRIGGFPGDRTLDSGEHQAWEKWHQVLAQFAALGRVARPMRFEDAVERLERLARDTLFQPETPDVPIIALGILESAQLDFDHLWVLGLTDEAWPLPARPHPFIPLALQRKAGVPQAHVDTSLELDRRITQGWLGAADEVVLTHACVKSEARLAPSPLIATIAPVAVEELGIGEHRTWREALFGSGEVEIISDGRAPAVEAAIHAGGTGLFRDQAACPFRAFARRRLHSEALEAAQDALDARARGSLLHEMMQAVWTELRSRAALDALPEAGIDALVAACGEKVAAGIRRYGSDPQAARLVALERRRLERAARALLAVERERADFEVVAMEQKQPVTYGGLTVQAKLDRMDRLAAGGHAILDYKASLPALSSWLGPRPEEPQLPMYALAGPDVRAVAFVGLKPGGVGFSGLAAADGLLPDVTTIEKKRRVANAERYRDWNALLAGWREELDALGEAFRTGEAAVSPKNRKACNECEQHALCRVYSRGATGADAAADEAA